MSGLAASFRELPLRTFADVAAWADWLQTDGEATAGLWVAFAKKGSGATSVGRADAVETAIAHGWIDGQAQPLDDRYWLVRFTPRRARSIWSQVNRVIADRLIAEGRMRELGLAEVERARADGR